MEDLEPPITTTRSTTVVPTTGQNSRLDIPTIDAYDESYYVDSNCSTPFVSAPSSPGRAFDFGAGGGGGYFYSAPASPVHFVLSTASLRSSGFVPLSSEASEVRESGSGSFEFEFSARFAASYTDLTVTEIGSMSSADELFLNGQIRPLKLSTHLQRPQVLAPLVDEVESDSNGGSGEGMGGMEKDFNRNGENVFLRSRDFRMCNKSLRRRTRSLSPLRNTTSFDWSELVVKGEDGGDGLVQRAKTKLNSQNNGDGDSKGSGGENEIVSNETTPSASGSSSRCSSAGRNSKRWVFLKDFLRSKSEGRSNHKFWTNISFSPAKEKKSTKSTQQTQPVSNSKKNTIGSVPLPDTPKQSKISGKETVKRSPAPAAWKPANGIGKRRIPPSAHEMHYTANRAQAEEMRKKTFLPYRQGLLGCLGFSSKSYGAINGLARALNPVSSR